MVPDAWEFVVVTGGTMLLFAALFVAYRVPFLPAGFWTRLRAIYAAPTDGTCYYCGTEIPEGQQCHNCSMTRPMAP